MFFFKRLDWQLNIAVLFLMAASLVSLFSTNPFLFYKQLTWYGIGLLLLILLLIFDWRSFINYRGVIFGIYLLVVALLIITYLAAPVIRGVKGWLVLGPFQLQISEFAKLILIIFYAYFFSRKHIGIARAANLLKSLFYFLLPAILVAIQPDLGSVLILFCIWFGFLLISGIPWKYLIIAFIIFLIVGIGMWQGILKEYQKERIIGLFIPERDPLGVNYSVIQSKIAIGSAGFLGKGFKQGTQSQLGFLPEAQTDFIFAAAVEEWGLLTAFLILAAFLILILRIIKIGLESDNNFARFVCLGTVILFSAQFIFNVGSNLGLTPVVGVTFPFLSYGGSSVLTNLILIGIIQSIHYRRM